MENNPVMLRLTVGQVNRLLNLLGTHPYNVSSDLIHAIKSQGDLQVAAMTKAPQDQSGQDPQVPTTPLGGNGGAPANA